MNIRFILRIIGLLVIMVSFTMIFSIIWALYYGETAAVAAIAKSMITGIIVGLVFFLSGINASREFYRKEALATVALSWIMSGIVGALPFYFSGSVPTFIDGFFESVSGFTTTGSSILAQVETLPKGILFWRAFTHWLGGMGIVLLFIAIFPLLGIGPKQMYRAEVPGVEKKGLVPQIKSSAMILWLIYICLTIAEIILLKVSGMNLFDSFCHTFATLATGGFSTKNASIAHYNSLRIDIIITVFMLLAGINFTLYFGIINKRFKYFFRDSELRAYLTIIFVSFLFVATNLFVSGTYSSVGESARHSIFQVVSIQTTTGFTTADFNSWPSFSKTLLVILMLIGACTGSTGGGMKVLRLQIIMKFIYVEVLKFVRPNLVKVIKIGKTVIEDETKTACAGFIVAYVAAIVIATMIISSMGIDIVTSLTSTIATISNIGPGLERVGAIGNYSFFPGAGKLLLSFCMILGRLELYTLLAIMLPKFWKE